RAWRWWHRRTGRGRHSRRGTSSSSWNGNPRGKVAHLTFHWSTRQGATNPGERLVDVRGPHVEVRHHPHAVGPGALRRGQHAVLPEPREGFGGRYREIREHQVGLHGGDVDGDAADPREPARQALGVLVV